MDRLSRSLMSAIYTHCVKVGVVPETLRLPCGGVGDLLPPQLLQVSLNNLTRTQLLITLNVCMYVCVCAHVCVLPDEVLC